jgi:hypothetical protein
MTEMYIEGVDVCCGEDKPEERKSFALPLAVLGLMLGGLGYVIYKDLKAGFSEESELEKERFRSNVLTYL